jgi:hypothetical protein
MSDLIDEATVRKFVRLLHTRAAAALSHISRPGVLQIVCVSPDDARGITISPFNIGDVDSMVETVLIAAKSGHNAYVETRTVRPGRPCERGRGKIESTIACFAFVVDRDADIGKGGHVNGDASAVVETSPNNTHEWLFLRRGLDAGGARPLGEQIRKATGTDHDTGVVTQPYRIPGTPNYPNAKKRARGRVVVPTKLIRVSDRLWTPDEITAAFPATAKPPRKARRAINGSGRPAASPRRIAAVKRRLADDATDMDRSAIFQSAVNAAVRAGITPEQFENLARQYPDGCAAKYLEHGDRLQQEIERSWEKAEQNDDAEPEPDADKKESEQPAPQGPPRSLAEAHQTFRKWFGAEYDLGTLNAVLAVVAAEKLSGDPPWLLLISGPGNAKTETIQAVSGLNTRGTISSEGALLSASPRRNRTKTATGGLLRQIGDSGILAIKDFTSIISANREVRMQVLAALREIHDGYWVRNVGSDGGQTLEWRGRVVTVGACTTVWDQAHAVVSTMGDRFVLARSNSSVGRHAAGLQAIRNTGTETQMRHELAQAVAGLIGQVKPTGCYDLSKDETNRILQAADIVTLARTGVETDYRGDIIDAHAPEMPTRFAKQLTQIMRGALAVGRAAPWQSACRGPKRWRW